jgi:hypothetical protein
MDDPSSAEDRDVSSQSLSEGLPTNLDPKTDLARLVERVRHEALPWVVVSNAALASWQRRDPAGWEQVRKWLAARGVVLVRV